MVHATMPQLQLYKTVCIHVYHLVTGVAPSFKVKDTSIYGSLFTAKILFR